MQAYSCLKIWSHEQLYMSVNMEKERRRSDSVLYMTKRHGDNLILVHVPELTTLPFSLFGEWQKSRRQPYTFTCSNLYMCQHFSFTFQFIWRMSRDPGTTLYLSMYQFNMYVLTFQLYFSVYMENIKRPGDNLILVHVPVYICVNISALLFSLYGEC